MRTEVTAEQLESYREDGFVVIEDFLDADEVTRLRSTILAAVEARGDAVIPADYVAQTTGAEHRAVQDLEKAGRRQLLDAFNKRRPGWTRMLSQHMNLWQTDERVRAFTVDPRLGRVAAELGEVDGVRIWHDQTMVKPAWGEPTAWHMDTPVFSFTHPATLTFWIALVDADLRNGCMYYIRGSHKLRMRTSSNWRLDGLKALNPEWEFADPVACPVRAGALIAHNGDTAHGAGSNMTPRPRPAFSITWMPIGATFNGKQNILPNDVFARLNVGDPLDLDDLFPIVYTREAVSAAH